ncbi:TPA: restriction endonuclease, partial [Pseudomonas aeruginosa]|nr:restriction endonuclease [Pseudomonas aeruginosa]
VHRRRDRTLSVDELKGLVRGRWVCAEADVVI